MYSSQRTKIEFHHYYHVYLLTPKQSYWRAVLPVIGKILSKWDMSLQRHLEKYIMRVLLYQAVA